MLHYSHRDDNDNARDASPIRRIHVYHGQKRWRLTGRGVHIYRKQPFSVAPSEKNIFCVPIRRAGILKEQLSPVFLA